FDLAYEPSYYEDSDLCFKIWASGRKILYCPDATVTLTHVDGSAANNDPGAETFKKLLVAINREKFISRWGEYLANRSLNDQTGYNSVEHDWYTARDRAIRKNLIHKNAFVYTNFALTPGGGERYLLTAATILAERYNVTLITSKPY